MFNDQLLLTKCKQMWEPGGNRCRGVNMHAGNMHRYRGKHGYTGEHRADPLIIMIVLKNKFSM